MEPSCSYAGGCSKPGIRLSWSLLHRVGVGIRAERAPGARLHYTPSSPPGSVEMAAAVLLVTCIVVVIALLGYCFFKNQRKDFNRHHHHQPLPPTPASSTVSTTEDTEHLVYNHTTQPL